MLYKDVESRYVHMPGRMSGMCQGFGWEIVGSLNRCLLCGSCVGVRPAYSDSILIITHLFQGYYMDVESRFVHVSGMPGMCEGLGLETVANVTRCFLWGSLVVRPEVFRL